MPRHSPCALYSLTYLRFLVLYSWIMQAINRFSSQNCNCYPLLSQKCSTIKNSQLFFQVSLKDLSVALLFHHMLHCSVFKVQLPASFEARSQNPIPWVLRSNAKLDSWWARVGSNHRPYDYQSYALASWATGPSSMRISYRSLQRSRHNSLIPSHLLCIPFCCNLRISIRYSITSNLLCHRFLHF